MKILALGPHPDDIELGCAGTIHKFKDVELSAIIFSNCEDEVPAHYQSSAIMEESEESLEKLGFGKRDYPGFPNKRLEEVRQEILDLLYKKKNSYDMIFCPSSFNSNQDHLTIYREARRAFRGTTLLGYSTPSSDYSFATCPIYSKLSEEDVEKKLECLSYYKTQIGKPYFDKESVRALIKATGIEIWYPFAEKFENIRFIL